MKLTILIITLACLHVSAATLAQNVTLHEKNVPLRNVLADIQQQTGFDLFYQDQFLKDTSVSIDVRNQPLATVLKSLLDPQQLTFDISDQTITIHQKETSFLENLKDKVKAFIANIDVHGKVVGDDGQPLPGATVIVTGTGNSTITDAKGEFSLKNVDPGSAIAITFVGYSKKEVKAAAELGTIVMLTASSPLDQVQIVAYGQQTQRLSVGSVATVSAKTIEQQPVNNPLIALEGQVPGAIITTTSGVPGANVMIQIRGQNSILSGTNPLYVIDGVPYFPQISTSLNQLVMGATESPLSTINPSDIESISILKDADATAIYGSRAANGAVLINTKKGKVGEMKVDVNVQEGIGKVPHFVDLLNTQQYLAMRHQALKNDGLNPYPSIQTTPSDANYDINGSWDTTRYTNWQKALLGGTSHYNDVNAAVSGGSPNIQYLVSGNFHHESTVYPYDKGNGDTKGGLHFALNTQSTDKRLKMTFTGSYMVDNNQLNTTYTQIALQLPPDAPSIYNSDGTFNWQTNSSGSSTWTNPAASVTPYQAKTNNLVSNLGVNYEILTGLTINLNLGYTNYAMLANSLNPITEYAPEQLSYISRNAYYATTSNNSWIVEPQINYSRTFGRGRLSALIGSTANQQNSAFQQLYGTGYNSDDALGNIGAATKITPQAFTQTVYKSNSVFARLNYTWADKYIIDLNARRDGSSRFGPANEFHDFWSAGAGWIFSEEAYMKQYAPWISFGKLRANYGTTGNDQIGDYKFLSTYNTNTPTVPYQGISGLIPSGFPNPYLQWELTHKFDAGMDLGLIKDRFLLTVDYFYNRSSNQLIGYKLPGFTGFGIITENLPAVIQNSGWEFTLNSTNVRNKDFSWRTTVNFTLPKNKLVSYPGLTQTSAYVIGQPVIGFLKLFHYLGIDQTTGTYQFAGVNGPTSTPDGTTDATVLKSLYPSYYGGMQNTFSYKSFQFQFFIQFTKQLGQKFFEAVGPGASGINQPVSVLANPWTPINSGGTGQRFNSDYSLFTAYNDYQYSDAGYADESFIRLKNASLSWNAPTIWAKAAGLKSLQIFVQGENLLTITPFKGLDPEAAGTGANTLPLLRVTTVGFKVGL